MVVYKILKKFQLEKKALFSDWLTHPQSNKILLEVRNAPDFLLEMGEPMRRLKKYLIGPGETERQSC